MRKETPKYLAKANEALDEARQVFAIGLLKLAARLAYYAAFHAAEAFIFERTDKVAKTHSGVRTEFARLLHFGIELDKTHSELLGRAYAFKEIADYDIENQKTVSVDECAKLIEGAENVLTAVTATLEAYPTPPNTLPR